MAQILERYVLHCVQRIFSIGTGLVRMRDRKRGGEGGEVVSYRARNPRYPLTRGVDSVKMISLVSLSRLLR